MSMEINSTNSGVTSQIMDLKTSTPGVTRKEEIKTGFKNTNDYSKYLQEKYSYMNTGSTSMQGVPVTVNVSGAFLKKCMDNPEKAAYLEENLAAIPECIKRSVEYTKTMPGSPVMTYFSVSVYYMHRILFRRLNRNKKSKHIQKFFIFLHCGIFFACTVNNAAQFFFIFIKPEIDKSV